MSFSQAPLGEVRRKRFCNRTKFLMIKDIQSRPTRARGLKRLVQGHIRVLQGVAPHAGAWIETPLQRAWSRHERGSRPTRARGLKRPDDGHVVHNPAVAPHAGAWIETGRGRCRRASAMSRPTRARGLKHANPKRRRSSAGVAPHAGAWIETGADGAVGGGGQVAPHAGAWIETVSRRHRRSTPCGRAPRGRVD